MFWNKGPASIHVRFAECTASVSPLTSVVEQKTVDGVQRVHPKRTHVLRKGKTIKIGILRIYR